MGNDNSTPNPPNEVFLARTCRWQHFRHLSNLAIVREISAKMPSEAGHRLYVKGRHISYQRGKRNTTTGTSLIQIEGVSDTKGANFYLGKKVAFVYRASKEVRGSKIRVIWGTISRTHGNSGMVRAKSETTFLLSLSVPRSESCCTHLRYKRIGLELDAWE